MLKIEDGGASAQIITRRSGQEGGEQDALNTLVNDKSAPLDEGTTAVTVLARERSTERKSGVSLGKKREGKEETHRSFV